ncbi:MAG: PP2C family serine/threonine-protein phosphatase [Anaerolineae bacterium]
MTPFRLTYGLTSVKGTARETNQDVAAARLFKPAWSEGDVGLFMVADGFGGKGEGERAAQIAVDTVMEAVSEVMSRDDAPTNIGELLAEAFKKANQSIFEVQSSDHYGATTLTAAVIIGDKLHIAHVGDTLVCYLADDTVSRLNIDHRGSSWLLQHGQITIDELKQAWVDDAYIALGQSGETSVDVVVETLHSNSTILICTYDFLHWRWKDELESELQAILRDNDPQTASDKLVALARERGTTSDITALVVRVG